MVGDGIVVRARDDPEALVFIDLGYVGTSQRVLKPVFAEEWGVEIVKAGVGLKDILFKISLSEARSSAPGAKPSVKSAARI